jgi:hypothetical protein
MLEHEEFASRYLAQARCLWAMAPLSEQEREKEVKHDAVDQE